MCALGLSYSATAQIVLELCPVTKIPADKQFNINKILITNNTGVEINTRLNKFKFEWPGLVKFAADLSGVITGDTWEGKIEVNNWPNTVGIGATSNPKSFNGSNYKGTLQIPAGGTFKQDGVVYEVTIKHCAQTDAYELYDHQFDFGRECFQSSPTDGLCLGEAATEIWKGTGVRDVMIPENRPSYAIGIMVAHRLFSNLVGNDEMVSPHFWLATGLNETGMICEGRDYIARRKNHCYVNSADAPCQQTGIGTNGTNSSADNCFQILSYGGFLAANQPDLFSQTNAYGTAGAANVVGGGNFETGLIGVVYYQYQSMQYWNHIAGRDVMKLWEDAKDPYTIEKLFYHGFHDGHGAATVLLANIFNNYATCIAANDMTQVVSGNTPTWNNTLIGSPKVANFTAVLDGNGNPYPQQKGDPTIEYYGCYEEDLEWGDVLYYFNEMKILYPQLMNAGVQSEIKAVFDGINSGADVNFTKFGPIIDEIVMNMGGHDPSDYLATQFGGSTSYSEKPLGVSLRTNDTICPGENGVLQLWLAGDAPFKATISYPDGSLHSFDNIAGSPFYITVNQPGEYEVISFEDKDDVGRVNCNFGKKTIESKNSSIVGWDKSIVDPVLKCAKGDLKIKKQGANPVSVSYTLNGTPQTAINLGSGDVTKTIATNVVGGKYIITTMTPNACGTPINDTILFCNAPTGCNKPASVSITNPSPINVCKDGSIVLSGSFVDGGKPVANGSLAYVWYKQGANPVAGNYTNTVNTVGNNSLTSLPTSGAGTYVLRVQDGTNPTDATCYTEQTVVVNVAALPSPPTVSSPTFCQNSTGASITANASTVNRLVWFTADVPSVTGRTTTTPTVSTLAAGIKTYYVGQETIGTPSCASSTRTKVDVTITAIPDLLLPSGNPNPVCSTATVNITNVWSDANATGGTVSYHSGTPATAGNTITNQAAITTTGTYYVKKANSTCIDELAVAVKVNARPKGVISGTKEICNDAGVTKATVTIDLIGAPNYNFTYTDGVTPVTVTGHSTNQYTFTTSADKSYSLTAVSDANCTATSLTGTANITYIDVPKVALPSLALTCPNGAGTPFEYDIKFDVTGGAGTGNYLINVFAEGTTTPVSGVTVLETNGAVSISGINEAMTVDVVVTDGKNCVPYTIKSQNKVCSCAEKIEVLVTGQTSICEEGTVTDSEVTLTFDDDGNGATSWNFSLEDKNGAIVQGHDYSSTAYTGATPLIISGIDTGSYFVRGVKGTCLGSGSGPVVVNYYQSPTVGISTTDDVFCTTETTAGYILTAGSGITDWTVEVDEAGTLVSKTLTSATSPLMVEVSKAGVYEIKSIKDGNGCTAKAADLAGKNVSIREVAQPVITMVAPAQNIDTLKIGTASTTVEVVDLGIGYTPAWTSAGEGAVTTVNGFSTSISGMSSQTKPGSITGINLSIEDVEGECQAATHRFVIERVAQTLPNLGDDITVCGTSGFPIKIALPNIIGGVETESIASDETGNASIVGREIVISNAIGGASYKLVYAVDHNIYGVSSDEITINVSAVPDATGVVATLANGCENTQVAANVGAIAGASSYVWKVTAGGVLDSESGRDALVTLSSDGITAANVEVVGVNACGNSTIVKADNIINQAPKEQPVIGGNAVVCGSISEIYTQPSPTLDATSWRWEWNSINKGLTASITLNSSDLVGTKGTLSLIPINNCGEGVAGTVRIDIQTPLPPQVKLDFTGGTSDGKACEEEEDLEVEIDQVFSNGGSGATYEYFIGSASQGITTSTNAILKKGDWKDGDVLTVKMTPDALTGCFTGSVGAAVTSNSIIVDGYKIPTPRLTSSLAAVCAATGSITLSVIKNDAKGDVVAFWENGRGIILGEASKSYLATKASQRGDYKVSVKNPECTTSGETNVVSIMLYEQPKIKSFQSAVGVGVQKTIELNDRYIYAIQDRDGVASGTIPVTVAGLVDDDSRTKYYWDALTIKIDENGKAMNFTKEGETEGVEWVSLVVVTGDLPEACIDSAGFYMGVSLPLEVPNAFSPNGDGTNDKWEIQGMNDYPNAHMIIFNRWGAKVYEKFDGYTADKAWDGGDYPVGTYYYILKLNKENKHEDEVVGAVTITR